ncbi:hypothetical protein [Singulisphaera acidiphila]|uniref:Glycine zipper domain-containing protein n=1 Tax=Singulisphaera acidiphila (strain ATCC BAA-1392 / DSM 18658 / VKM B-2454 / MOB10) TaxID=886293 RepID=L0DJN2_SINAD|nr:hypothetical protein [Singulisphaera acidiphila]AGA29055.1 hypothetical protein Sinac_4899 [Singulisphaera acidiphila DSM 18658]
MAHSDKTHEKVTGADPNLDPISGEPGAHPFGVGLGAAVGGATAGVLGGIAAGAVSGTAAGPIGSVVGAVVGGVAGGLAGKGIAESIDPTVEDAYWRANHTARPYYDPSRTYDDYEPAYRHGWESRSKYEDKSFDDVESDLQHDWETRQAKPSSMSWEKARPATRDAWDRLTEQ